MPERKVTMTCTDRVIQRKCLSDFCLSNGEHELLSNSCLVPYFRGSQCYMQGLQCDMCALNGEHNACDPFNTNSRHLVPIASLKELSCSRANVPDSSQYVQEALSRGQPRLRKRDNKHFLEGDPQVELVDSSSLRQEVVVQQTATGISYSEQGCSTIVGERAEKGDNDGKTPEKQMKNVCDQKEVEVINPDILTVPLCGTVPLLKVHKFTNQHLLRELRGTYRRLISNWNDTCSH